MGAKIRDRNPHTQTAVLIFLSLQEIRLKTTTSHCNSTVSCSFNTRLCDISDTWLCLEDLVMPKFMSGSIHLHQKPALLSTNRFRACTDRADLFSEQASMPDLQKSCEHSSPSLDPCGAHLSILTIFPVNF